MKLAHIADPHLGIRQYHRQTSAGINQREADIAQAFRAAVDGVIAAHPDAVVVAGDLFHSVRPTNHAIVFAFRQFQRLREALPNSPIVLIAGNHDTPRTVESGSILRLFEEMGVDVATEEPRRLVYPELDLSIFAVPRQAVVSERPTALEPEGSQKYQVLVAHFEVEGEYPLGHVATEYSSAAVSRRELHLKEWSYVALGHYHTQHQVAKNAWYAGALDYIGPNIWGEAADEADHGSHGKGWLLVDLESGRVQRQPVPAARAVLDLAPIQAEDKSAEAVNELIAERIRSIRGGIADQIVRLRVFDISRHVARELNHAAIRALKAQALHFRLDLRHPETHRIIGIGSPGRRQTLPELVSSYLERRPLPAELEREAFVRLGRDLMDSVERDLAGGLMQINRLRLQNFRQHENTEIEFGLGLTGIIGPNGAGKTTLLEAIAWAMYGMPAARGSRETLRRRGASPKARVEVEIDFTLGAHQYRIVRSLTHAELYQDGDPSAVANSIGAVTERVTRLLGMTREEFFNTYFTGQKELAVMAAMSAPERAQFLSRVLGYERLRVAQERLKEQRSALRARLEGLRAGLADSAELEAARNQAEERLKAASQAETSAVAASDAAERHLASIRPQWEKLQQLREAAIALEAEIKLAEQKSVSSAERLTRLEQDAAEAATARVKLDEVRRRLAPLPQLREEAQALERQAEAYAARNSYKAQLQEVRDHLGSIQERISRLPTQQAFDAALERMNAARASLTAVTLDSEERRTVWVRDAQDAKTKRQGLLDQFQELKDQRERIVRAGVEGVCPTCARPLGVEYAKVLELLDRQIEEVRSNGNYYKQRIEQLQQEPAMLADVEARKVGLEHELSDATAQHGRLQAQAHEAGPLREEQKRLSVRMTELEGIIETLPEAYDQTRHEAVVRETRALEPLALQAERFRVVSERAESIAADLDNARVEAAKIAQTITDLRSRLAGLGYSETAFKTFRETEQTAERVRREAELTLVRAKAEHSAAQEAVNVVIRRQGERDERERAAVRTADELALHQELDRALTDLRNELNSNLRPDLSDLASSFLSDLTDGRYAELELDEDYTARVRDNGDLQSVISGGEEDVTNLAFRLAISQMIAERAGQPLSMLMLDEIFGSLDESRRNAVVDLLRSLADRFSQVILVTHVDIGSFREGFDRVVQVGFDLASGVATVRDEPVGDRDVAA